MKVKPNYAIKPIAEQALRPNQTIVPQRLIAALEIRVKVSNWEESMFVPAVIASLCILTAIMLYGGKIDLAASLSLGPVCAWFLLERASVRTAVGSMSFRGWFEKVAVAAIVGGAYSLAVVIGLAIVCFGFLGRDEIAANPRDIALGHLALAVVGYVYQTVRASIAGKVKPIGLK